MCSFDSGIIFLLRLGQDLSRNAPVVSGYAFPRKMSVGKDFFMHRKVENLMKNEFCRDSLGSFHEASGVLLECRGTS